MVGLCRIFYILEAYYFGIFFFSFVDIFLPMEFGGDPVLFLKGNMKMKTCSLCFKFIFSATFFLVLLFCYFFFIHSQPEVCLFFQVVNWSLSDSSERCVWVGVLLNCNSVFSGGKLMIWVLLARLMYSQRIPLRWVESKRSVADFQEQLRPSVTSYESFVFYVCFSESTCTLSSVDGCLYSLGSLIWTSS